MAIPIVQADLENRLNVSEVARYSGGVTAKITESIAEAWDRARSAALNVFTAASWDAMTTATLPNEAKGHIVSDACDILSYGKGRPDDIQRKSDDAKMWRSWLAGDTVRCFDGILIKIGTSGGVSFNAPSERTFDRDNASQGFNFRDQDI